MSKDNDTVDNSDENLVEDPIQGNSAKDKILTFVKNNQKELLIALGCLVFVLFIGTIVYLTCYRKSSIEEYADKFCQCAETSQSEFFNYTNDGFGYRSDLNTCFTGDFRQYGENYTRADKKQMLLEFQKHVIKKCPKKLAGIFEYK